MEENYKRQMGIRNYSERLQVRISEETGIQGDQTHSCPTRSKRSYKFRNRKSFKEKRYRKSKHKKCTSRFLQHFISSCQKIRGNETSHKLTPPQQVFKETSLQNGYSVHSSGPSSDRRLGIDVGSKRRIFSYKSVQEAPKVSEVLFPKPGVSIQSALFWSNSQSEGLYKSSSSRHSTFTSPKHKISVIPRRLVGSKSVKTDAITKQRFDPQSPVSTGFHCKQRQVKFSTQSEIDIYRGSISFKQRSCLSNRNKGKQFEDCNKKDIKRAENCKTISCSSRPDCIFTTAHSQCQTIYETHSVTFTGTLESSQNGYVSKNTIDSTVSSTSELVVTGSEHFEGLLFSTEVLSSYIDHRCESMGVGRSPEWLFSARPLVENSKSKTCELVGIGGCVSSSETFSSISEESKCADQDRQYNGYALHQQTRGYEVSSFMSHELGLVESGFEEQYPDQSCTYNGQTKLSSRPLVSQGDPDWGMDPKELSRELSVCSLGAADDRSFCDSREQESNAVLFMDSVPTCICAGCPIGCMGEHVCICIPSDPTYSQSTLSHETVPVYCNTDSAMLASSAVVPNASQSTDSKPCQTSMQSGSFVSESGEGITPRTRDFELDGMDVVDRHLSTKGFSTKTRKLLSASWRKGTKRDYNCKFRQFSRWCDSEEIDPLSPSLVDCAHFVTFLFEKGLKYKTITGYRSMLSSILPRVEGFPIGQHPNIIRLLKGIFNERPPLKKLVPEWNLCLILGCLRKSPFEPLKDASLKHVTWKTCFLVAITTFRRCSDLQSLQLGEETVNVQKKGVTFIRTGMAKQDRPSHVSSNIFVPAFTKDKLLDPKRALTYYLKRTEIFRKTESTDTLKMFIAVNKPHKPVSCTTISRWITNTIKFCYRTEGKTPGRVHGHQTRSYGPSWARFKGTSSKDIMEAADWSRETTFVKYYLKDVRTSVLEV